MLNAVLLLTAVQTSLSPMLPAGANPDVHVAFQAVAKQTVEGKFDQAKANLRLAPSLAVTYHWDVKNLPANLAPEWDKIRAEAFRNLSNRIPGLTFKPSATPAIRFSFERSLAEDPTTGLPRGIAVFFSENPGEPRMEAVIGLDRGKPTEKTNAVSLYNEIVFAVGSYLGLNSTPFLGSIMGRSDLQMQYRSNPDPNELSNINAIQAAVKRLKEAVDKKQAVTPAIPSVGFDPIKIEKGPVIQGAQLEFSVQVSNLGNAPLSFKVIPDCGCVTAGSAPLVQPGTSVAVPMKVDTSEIVGELNRHIILISNDAENPIQFFPIHVRTQPRYRFLTTDPSVLIVGEEGLDTDLFLVSPTEKPLEITSVEIQGNPGQATFEPWKGKLADPGMKEAAMDRSGYKIKLHLDEPPVTGRSAATVIVKTSDPKFPTVRHVMFAQKGIAAMPASVFFGDLGKAEREATLLLTRPNKPFKILKIESDSANVNGRAVPTQGEWEYKIIATYSGKAPEGDFRATLTITTDDPKQPKIRVPVMGIVK